MQWRMWRGATILWFMTVLGIIHPNAFAAAEPPSSLSKFQKMSDEFMKESLALSPSSATDAGYHKHVDKATGKVVELDAILDDMSLDAIKRQTEFYERWRAQFHNELPPASLSAEDAADWQLIDDRIGLNLLELQKIENYKHNPTVVVEMIGGALFQPLAETYASKQVRLSHVISRIGQIPRVLSQVKAYVDNADPVFVSTAIDENAGNVDLIQNTIEKEVERYPALKPEFEKVASSAISALNDFSNWMKNNLAKRPCSRNWRLGRDLYNEKFKLVLETNISPEQLLHDAEREVTTVRGEMLSLSLPMHKQMFPQHSDHSELNSRDRQNLIISEVLNKVSEDHPARDQLQQAIERDLQAIKEFIRANRIVSLSSRDNLKVIPTPPFMRGIYSVAGFHSAPPLEPTAEAEYWVTPIDPKIPADKAESKLREYNNYTLKWLTIHEALPGHYIQYEHLNNIQPEQRRLLRSLYGNGAYVEGWAEYIAQVMMDEGFMKNDPRFRLIMRKIRLRVLANTILDIRMQTMGMTDAEAMELMTKQTFQTQSEAEGKLQRAKLSSAQLPTYYAGLRDWLEFRKRYQQKLANNFDLLKFHNAVLDLGPLPVSQIEKLMSTE